MKRPLAALLVLAAVSVVVAAGYTAAVQTVASRLEAKGARVEAGLELYFSRASQRTAGRDGQDASLRIMVARRAQADVPFDEPRVLDAIDGFVEAPSLSLDGREMFFHKKVDGRSVIYRAERGGTR